MGSSKLLISFKKHKRYLYTSLTLIILFFAVSALITPKITLVAENLLEDVVQENLTSKKNSIAFEFNNLNSFLIYSEKIVADSIEIPAEQLQEKLRFTADLAQTSPFILNSYFYNLTPKGWTNLYTTQDPINKMGLPLHYEDYVRSEFIDTILKLKDRVIYRKFYVHRSAGNSITVVGNDIDLLAFWNYFSESNEARIGYTVVTTGTGICLLHPEPKYIGTRLDSYFTRVSLNAVLNHSEHSDTKLLTDEAKSEYLNLDVKRYFDKVVVGNSSLLVIESFPLAIILKERTQKINRYFLWISLLAFIVFMGLLLVSRYQLKKEFLENLKVVEEKEQLINANEKYQKENALLQLNQLKKKMNPHFLFNSLNSLHILIESKPELSQEFLLKLSDVYRYLLENKEGDLILVKKELRFLNQYFFLQKIRFGASIQVLINNTVDEAKVYTKKIPFLALETVVENAIKHNEFTKQNPLQIELLFYENYIEVINTYTPRKTPKAASHKLGLIYLKNTYNFYNIEGFQTEITGNKFKCRLPLLP